MTDIFTKEKRSEIMSKIGPKDSLQELFIRSLVHRMGYRFRLHRKDLPGKPDLVFPKYKKVIFINGCFWHGHEECNKSKLPDSNRQFWEEKIKNNTKKDIESYNKLKALGWDYFILWQCGIKRRNVDNIKASIRSFLG